MRDFQGSESRDSARKAISHAPGGGAYEFTSKLFFDENLTETVHARQPYAAKGPRDTRNQTDRFFGDGGDQLLLGLTPRADRFDSTFSIGLDLSDARTGRSDRWDRRARA